MPSSSAIHKYQSSQFSSIPEQLCEQSILHNQQYYLSLKINKIVYKQSSELSQLIQRCDLNQKTNKDQNRKIYHSVQSLVHSPQCVFIFSLEECNKNNNKQSDQRLKAFGFQDKSLQNLYQATTETKNAKNTQSASKTMELPQSQSIRQIKLKSWNNLNLFIQHSAPNCPRQFEVKVFAQISRTEIFQVGFFKLDPNKYIWIHQQEKIKSILDRKVLYKKIANKELSTSLDIQVDYQIGVSQSRVLLQKHMLQSRDKVTSVAELRSQIQALKQRNQMDIHLDQFLLNDSISKQKNCFHQKKSNNSATEIYYQIRIFDPFVQQKNHDNVENENINSCEKKLKEQPSPQSVQTVSGKVKEMQISTAQKFQNYLKKTIEPQLIYFSPQRRKIQDLCKHPEPNPQKSSTFSTKTNQDKQTNMETNKFKQKQICHPINSKIPSTHLKQDTASRKELTLLQKITERTVNIQNKLYKMKLLLFLIFSVILIAYVMSPNRKVYYEIPYKKEYK